MIDAFMQVAAKRGLNEAEARAVEARRMAAEAEQAKSEAERERDAALREAESKEARMRETQVPPR